MKGTRIIALFSALVVLVTVGIGASSGCTESVAKDKAPLEARDLSKSEQAAPADDLKSEVRNHSGFEGVSIGGALTATVTVGKSFEVIIEAREDVLPKVKSKVKDNTLYVGMEKGWWKNNSKKYKRSDIRVTVSLPTLSDLDISGASKASVSGVNSDKMSIDVSGASDVKIEGNARDVNIDMSGASRLNAEGFYTEIAEMDLSGASRVTINVSTDLNVDASGASSVKYIGEPNVRKDTSGASSVYKN